MDGKVVKAAESRAFGERDLLPLMEVQIPGRRNHDGTISALPVPFLGNLIYGPFLRLSAGRYCLSFTAQPGMALPGNHPILGVEVIAQNRILQAWRDFTAAELGRGEQRISFEVPDAISAESESDAPFEFRFVTFGRGTFRLTGLSLRSLDANGPLGEPMTWRLLGRLRRLPLPGRVTISPLSIMRFKFGQPWTRFCLPAGRFNLDLDVEVASLKRADDPALEVRLVDHERDVLAERLFLGRDLAGGRLSIPFSIPADISYEAGRPARLGIQMRHFGTVRMALDGIRVVRTSDIAENGEAPARPSTTAHPARKSLLVLGNCQARILARALRNHHGFSRRFQVFHHELELPDNLREQARRDLEASDILLVQDIKEWEQYPLRDHVPASARILRYPCIRFASLWPFDAFNGPDDRLAAAKDYPNFEFTYFDGLLARLRREIPGQEERFLAYRDLASGGIINPARLHVFEERRLQAMDQKFDTGIGRYVLENFRRRRLFHTTAHPNGKLLNMLLGYIERELGARCTYWITTDLDTLRDLQVPVHPAVARTLSVSWADEKTHYRYRGRMVTWEQYFRRYISYYG
ncbi:MAG TPA: WcbI family polysaccharide biosynthesis putative acetyltransferase [Bosea sp. (in: a-proteobacteria)]|jgi:hypothetical protein|nr:WcbI family polysaccharide biosynthesis putative acetyltransferase [Bosea sp. (in: a-proteobacteria)]